MCVHWVSILLLLVQLQTYFSEVSPLCVAVEFGLWIHDGVGDPPVSLWVVDLRTLVPWEVSFRSPPGGGILVADSAASIKVLSVCPDIEGGQEVHDKHVVRNQVNQMDEVNEPVLNVLPLDGLQAGVQPALDPEIGGVQELGGERPFPPLAGIGGCLLDNNLLV